jgi:hypothetical protein
MSSAASEPSAAPFRASHAVGAVVAALALSVPAILRPAPGHTAPALLVTFSLTLPLVLAVQRLFTSALGEVRQGDPWRLAGIMAALGTLGLACVGLAGAFAALLKRTTHHHGLAGVTFGVGIVVLLLFVMPVAVRFVAFVEARMSAAVARSVAGAGLRLAMLGFGLASALLLRRASGAGAPELVAAADMVSALFAASVSAFVVDRIGTAAPAPPVSHAVLVLVGVLLLAGVALVVAKDPGVRAALDARAPLQGWVARALVP